MDSPTEFEEEIGGLIAEIEAKIGTGQAPNDREFELQRAAFAERASQARHLAQKLSAETNWHIMDGDAHRIRAALRLSRAYFGRKP